MFQMPTKMPEIVVVVVIAVIEASVILLYNNILRFQCGNMHLFFRRDFIKSLPHMYFHVLLDSYTRHGACGKTVIFSNLL